MKNLFNFIILISISTSLYAKPIKGFSAFSNEAKQFKEKDLRDMLAEFVRSTAPSRMPGTDGHAKAILYLQNKIKEIDSKSSGNLVLDKFELPVEKAVKLYQDDFQNKVVPAYGKSHPEYAKWKRFTDLMTSEVKSRQGSSGTNIIWEKTGKDAKKWITIMAHFDTISHDKSTFLVKAKDKMPGANYNGSGVAIALALINLYSKLDLNHSVRVAFVDYSVFGFMGSEILSNKINSRITSGEENSLMVFNLEMLGQDTIALDRFKKLGNLCVYGPKDSVLSPDSKKTLEMGEKMTKEVSFEYRGNGYDGSDHVRFWEKGLNALVFSQNWEDDFNHKFYQTPQDTPETLNFKTLYNSYLSLAGMTGSLVLEI